MIDSIVRVMVLHVHKSQQAFYGNSLASGALNPHGSIAPWPHWRLPTFAPPEKFYSFSTIIYTQFLCLA